MRHQERAHLLRLEESLGGGLGADGEEELVCGGEGGERGGGGAGGDFGEDGEGVGELAFVEVGEGDGDGFVAEGGGVVVEGGVAGGEDGGGGG